MKLSPVIIIAAAALAGAGGGAGLRFVAGGGANSKAPEEAGAETHAAATDVKKKEAAPDEQHDKEKKKAGGKAGGKAGDKHGEKAGEAAYFKFSRQFVAPIVSGGAPKAMIILDVMIELAPDADDAIYADEPKLRDAVLKALLVQSANGELPEMLTDPNLLEKTRAVVLANVREVIGEDARSVLLMDVGYQPF
jgi:hypothetical protein